MMKTIYMNKRLITEDFIVSNDTRKTGLNNNDLVIGVSGAGKTGSYVIPNILNTEDSFVVTDTKSNLYRNYRKSLENRGFSVYNIDLIDPANSMGYDPLDYVETTMVNGSIKYSERDILSISTAICPTTAHDDAFWLNQARTFICCLITYVLENFEGEERNLASVADLFKISGAAVHKYFTIPFLDEYSVTNPDSYATRCYELLKPGFRSDKTWGCIELFVANALRCFDFDSARKMLSMPKTFRFENLGTERCALFINDSYTDRCHDPIVDVFYTQIFQTLCKVADNSPDSRLPVPVRVILDDFAAGTVIPDFDKLISVIRSRDIYTSIILQSISQLDSIYSASQKWSIVNNCDTILYLGGTDLTTIDYLAERIRKPSDEVMALELDKAYVIQRGMKSARKVTKTKPYTIKENYISQWERYNLPNASSDIFSR